MQLIWRRTAVRDLERVIGYIAEHDRAAARRQMAEIEQQVQRLAEYPHSGRLGRVERTRELVVVRTSFIVIYRVGETVELLRVIHGAQAWPPAS